MNYNSTKTAEYHIKLLHESPQEGLCLYDKNNMFIKFLVDAESSAILLRKMRDEAYNIVYMYTNESMHVEWRTRRHGIHTNLILFFKL